MQDVRIKFLFVLLQSKHIPDSSSAPLRERQMSHCLDCCNFDTGLIASDLMNERKARFVCVAVLERGLGDKNLNQYRLLRVVLSRLSRLSFRSSKHEFVYCV